MGDQTDQDRADQSAHRCDRHGRACDGVLGGPSGHQLARGIAHTRGQVLEAGQAPCFGTQVVAGQCHPYPELALGQQRSVATREIKRIQQRMNPVGRLTTLTVASTHK